MEISQHHIPKETVTHILSFLDGVTLAYVGIVCKLFYQISNNDDLWKRINSDLGYKLNMYQYSVKNEKDTFKYFYELEMNKTTQRFKESSSQYPCHSTVVEYFKPTRKSRAEPCIPSQDNET